MKLNKLRVYVNADNVFTITDYNGYDPEVIPVNALTQGLIMAIIRCIERSLQVFS